MRIGRQGFDVRNVVVPNGAQQLPRLGRQRRKEALQIAKRQMDFIDRFAAFGLAPGVDKTPSHLFGAADVDADTRRR